MIIKNLVDNKNKINIIILNKIIFNKIIKKRNKIFL